MIVTKQERMSRAATVLRGIGATLALPLLDGMVPALRRRPRRRRANAGRRFGVVYVPNGMMMPQLDARDRGAGFEFTPILQAARAVPRSLLVVTGLERASGQRARTPAPSTRFLTDVAGKSTEHGASMAGISMDQFVATELGAGHAAGVARAGAWRAATSPASCDIGYSCAYTNTISWRSPTTPLPMENNPRVVFERLFGDGGTTDAARAARAHRRPTAASSTRSPRRSPSSASAARRARPRASSTSTSTRSATSSGASRRPRSRARASCRVVEQPAGIPATFDEHAQLMFDLQVLAYQTDLTRVITFMMGREIQRPDLSRRSACPTRTTRSRTTRTIRAKIADDRQDQHLPRDAVRVLPREAAVDAGRRRLAARSHVLLYGAGMTDSNAHSPDNLPILLVGGAAGQIKGGRHLRYSEGTPLANLHLTLLDKLGVPVEKIGNSVAPLALT